MKRPLCVFSLLFLTLVWIVLTSLGPPLPVYHERAGDIVTVAGIVENKEIKSDYEVFYLRDVRFCDGAILPEENEKKDYVLSQGIVCYVTDMAMPPMGALIFVQGRLSEFKEATNPGEFDLQKYYLYKGYAGRISVDSWEAVHKDSESYTYSVFKESLWNIRCILAGVIDETFDEEDAGVLKALLLGDKSDLSGETKDLYRASGIAHILAISGLHVSLLGMGLYKLLRKMTLPLKVSALVSVSVMVSYAVMTGESLSTNRALIMFFMTILADVFHRSYDLITALALAAVTVVFGHPYEIMTSGFWMSYLAVCGVALFYPALTQGIHWEKNVKHRLLQAFLTCTAVSVFTMPLITLYYYEVPVYSILINMIVIPLMTWLMIGGIITVALGCICPPIADIASWPVCGILRLYRQICECMERIPGHSFVTGAPAGWQVLVCYALFFAVILLAKRLSIGKRLLFVVTGLTILWIRFTPQVRVVVLDVGQGDGILVCTQEATLFFDGGSTSKNNLYTYQIEKVLLYYGISEVDYWFLSHPDRDHTSGLCEMLDIQKQQMVYERKIRIGTIVLPNAYGVEEDFSALIASASELGYPVMLMARGDRITIGKTEVYSLHPQAGYSCDDVNTYSQVHLVCRDTFAGIFTGDATTESEEEICDYLQDKTLPPVTMLKVGHHGSHTSSSEEFLRLLHPTYAMISCGRDNSYGHPHSDVLERLEDTGCVICRTDRQGCITLSAQGNEIRVIPFCR